jgi:hypothetical protein
MFYSVGLVCNGGRIFTRMNPPPTHRGDASGSWSSPETGWRDRADRQVAKHGLAGFFGLSERIEGRAANPDGGPVLIDRTPGRHEAGSSLKAGTAAALITDHERKAVSIRVPYFHLLDATDDADELHGRSTHGPSPLDKPPSPSEGGSWVVAQVWRLPELFK